MASKKYVIMTDGTYKAVEENDGSLATISGGVIAAEQNFVFKLSKDVEENYATFNDFSVFGQSFEDESNPNDVKGYAFPDKSGALLSDAHGFEGDAKTEKQLSYHLDYNSSVRNSRFAPDYQLDGMAGSSAVSSVFTRENEEALNVIFELFTLVAETLIVATSLHLITGLAIATDRSISSSKKLGRYRNYSDVGYVKYLVEKLNFPVDLIVNDYQNHRLGTTDIEKKDSSILGEFGLSFFYVNIYLMIGLGEYFFPGNFVSDKLDNILLKQFNKSYEKNRNIVMLFASLAGVAINNLIEAALSEDSYYNILKLTIRKMQGSEQYIANKETTNENYNFNDEDLVAKHLHLATKSYLTKFTIERINAGKQVFNIMTFSNLLESDNPFGEKKQEAIKIYPHKIAEGVNKGYTYTSIKNTKNLLLELRDAGYDRRFKNKVVKIVENYLKSSQYVPFYIRDLRSNEIIHMHSFIESFTDSISAQYNETGGFGRVDKIKRWESTTRSINIGFYMVATQPEDHDLMWLKINKIANMLYPQWSDSVGRVARTDKPEKYFKFPFTSVPTATPLVRIKLGDVLTSNHSEVNIKRIHGYNSSSSKNFDLDAVEPQTSESGKTKYNNPILAAYMTTQGDGLAGVIDSFNVDFSNELPWETKQGSSAPIYTKITLGFKPIHDIPPGMSHDGYMRAPIYRVGKFINPVYKFKRDTDGDGIDDIVEKVVGTDPDDKNSKPANNPYSSETQVEIKKELDETIYQ